MLLKIKNWLKNHTIPISIKLTALYASILCLILLLTSTITVFGMRHILTSQIKKDLVLSSINIKSYLNRGHPLDQRIFSERLLRPNIDLRVYDGENNLLLDNNPYMQNENKDQNLTEIHQIEYKGQTYQLQFRGNTTKQSEFMEKLIGSLLLANLIGLLIAIVSGIYLSRKILAPIRHITSTAQQIEIDNLNSRIPTSNSNDELHKLAETFNYMLDRLQLGLEKQKRFVADASHELRTPITIISGYADMLSRWGKKDPSALEEGILAIKSEVANMYNLIQKLLFLARADQNRQVMHKQTLETHDLLDEVVRETSLIAQDHHVVLKNNPSACIMADPNFIKQMFRIFIENSIKFTPKGGNITISAVTANHSVEIVFSDTGIGIPEEHLNKIFDRFYRVDKSRTKASGGTGLGLSIAKWIAEQHNIQINITSLYGQGTQVHVIIPCSDH